MRWMEALREMEIFFRQTPTTFYTFVNKLAPKACDDIFICRGFPKYRLIEDSVQIALRDANKSKKVLIFENPAFGFDWRWYPESLTLVRSDASCVHKNTTYEEMLGIEGKTSCEM